MALDLPRPTVPGLDPYGVLNIEELNQQALRTYCQATTQAAQMWLHPLWRGTTSSGKALDIRPTPLYLLQGDETMLVEISFSTLTALDQGHAVFSYTVQPDQESAHDHDESDRVNILIGQRHFPGAGLNVASIKEAHELQFDHSDITDKGAMAMVPPWQAMHAGDHLTLIWSSFSADGGAIPELNLYREVFEPDVGLPMAFLIDYAYIAWASQGRGLLSYVVEYVGGGKTVSPVQTFTLLPAPADRLPALRILGHDGGTIDPGLVGEGLTFSIQAYAQLQEGDSLIISAEDPANNLAEFITAIRLDRSSVDSGLLNVSVLGDWLEDYLDRRISLRYHLCRPGLCLAGDPLTLSVRATMTLPAPVVDGASGAGEGEGEFKAWDTADGIRIRVPSRAVYPAGAQVRMHWEGFAGTGSQIVSESDGGRPPTFVVSPSVVAPNIGKVVKVFYRVTAEGDAPRDSEVFNVRVLPIPAYGYPTLQCPDARNGELHVSGLPSLGARLTLAVWPLIALEQRVTITAIGTLRSGLTTSEEIYSRSVTSMTAPVSTYMDRTWLTTLAPNKDLELTVTVTADAGETKITFPRIYLKIISSIRNATNPLSRK